MKDWDNTMYNFKIWIQISENTFRLKDIGKTSFDGDEHTMIELLASNYSKGALKSNGYDKFFSWGDIIELSFNNETWFYQLMNQSVWNRFLYDAELSFLDNSTKE